MEPSRLHSADAFRTASVGLQTRKLRAALSALGIMIGIAAMVGVLGLSESSKSDLLAQLDRLGTNLLTVQAGSGIGIGSGELPAEAAGMISRIGPVEQTSTISSVDANVYKSDFVPEGQTGGITVQAVDVNLLETLAGSMADGKFLDAATATYPTAVLGSVAAARLAIHEVTGTQQIWLGGQWFTVIGVLDEFELNPDLDRAALIGLTTAEDFLDHEVVPSSILVRADPDFIDEVTAVLSATANPQNPEEVEVARPSDALEAKEAADDAFTALFLGLGGVALLVGGVGIANVMVISVLERRSEIGLRRALGATKRHVAVQFLGEALLLSAVGGVGGVALGWAVTGVYANVKGWSVLIPPVAIGGGMAAALLIGAVAGLYPAVRAARMSPTEALRSA
ncbi:MAG: ABC transporter permease [Acidimicrobiia bacterium]|nr:ABC transporter permease [Acidimicrobiia bacterium]MDX2468715.1 ABC transporter permease [Acidimicrobiia bacterium]